MIPDDVKKLIQSHGYIIYIESGAGEAAGISDQDYLNAGAQIRFLNSESLEAYQALFANIDLIIRAKRPHREREILENQAIPVGIIMIGALDPFEKDSPHISEYQSKKLITYSLDQAKLDSDHPMNLLAAMSKIAGKLALLDALNHIQYPAKKVLIIGFGVIGHAVLQEAFIQNIEPVLIVTNQKSFDQAKQLGVKEVFILSKNLALQNQQDFIRKIILSSHIDLIITSARSANTLAPILIPNETLSQMKAGTVIIDMAISEGGNVEGSHHDQTLILGNHITVTNVSGYPKKLPHEASILWSQATRLFIETLFKA